MLLVIKNRKRTLGQEKFLWRRAPKFWDIRRKNKTNNITVTCIKATLF